MRARVIVGKLFKHYFSPLKHKCTNLIDLPNAHLNDKPENSVLLFKIIMNELKKTECNVDN